MSSSNYSQADRFAFRTTPVPESFPARPNRSAETTAQPPLLQVEGLRKVYGGLEAVAGVDLSLPFGRITGLIGPNGAGKTTLLNVISNVERPTAGRVLLQGEDISALPQYRLAERGMVRTFQISRELGQLTVLENLLLARPRQTGEKLIGVFGRAGRVRREEEAGIEAARAVLLKVNLWRLADAPAAALSGGQKKLLELSRALMLSPRLVLLDEPAAGVAPAMEQVLIDTIRGLATEGVDFLIVEHDLDVVASLCSHVFVMAGGRILTQGTFAQISGDSRVVEAYLGLKA
ncbi:MAG: ABC transporter ATP-binding protein [Xanthobacteraceae bacterium]|nr:ABC transporter ATP-binding protein [Xanthobacteraceae bacterium]